jgi:hypothetical protein
METHTGKTPTPELVDLVTRTLAKRPVHWKTPHTGLSAAQRFVVRFEDGSSAFVKAAVDADTERWLRVERTILSTLEEDFIPRTIAWAEEATHPVLMTEDLSYAHWPADQYPVLWLPGQFDAMFRTLERVAATAAPETLPSAEQHYTPCWHRIAEAPERFLALGLCPERWYRDAIDGLVQAESALSLAGEALVHGDVRSDNVCFLGERMVLVDWSGASRGNPLLDKALVAGSIPLEGGPDPFDVMPDGGLFAAHQSGFLAWRALHPSEAPNWLVKVFLRMALIQMRWAAQALDLPPWTGLDWREID